MINFPELDHTWPLSQWKFVKDDKYSRMMLSMELINLILITLEGTREIGFKKNISLKTSIQKDPNLAVDGMHNSHFQCHNSRLRSEIATYILSNLEMHLSD